MKVKLYKSNRQRRQIRSRSKIKSFKDKARLSVFRSNKYIYAQIIDNRTGNTLITVSDSNLKGTKTKRAFEAGVKLSENALKKGIKEVIFDRGSYKYHGRVKSLAEGARKGGLKF